MIIFLSFLVESVSVERLKEPALSTENEDPSFSDLILVCQGKEIKAHRLMLAARSEVFKTMLTNEEFIEGTFGSEYFKFSL
jgi:hypothetical protein